MMKVLIATAPKQADEYLNTLRAKAADTKLNIEFYTALAPSETDVIIYEPSGPIQDFTAFSNLKLVQSIWAGADAIIGNKTLRAPLCRMVDKGLEKGMREYVCGHILADHIRLDEYNSRRSWDDSEWLPLAQNLTVGIIGMGILGTSVAGGLKALEFNVIGWTRSGKDGSLSGEDGLNTLLQTSDYVVTLLPHTPETENLINADRLSKMKQSAVLINPGRGALIDETALHNALDNGMLRKAVLDVFKTEPLPDGHPFWSHPKIIVTPHIAAKSRVDTCCDTIIENLKRLSDDKPLLYKVDLKRGY